MSDGEILVCALIRPFADEQCQAGIAVAERFTKSLSEDDVTYAVFSDLTQFAAKRLETETNALLAPQLYGEAGRWYNNTRVTVEGQTFNFTTPKVLCSGEVFIEEYGTKIGFFLMEELPGSDLFGLTKNVSPEEVRQVKLGTLTKEFHNILNGRFDSDRHGGQFRINLPTIGHLDFMATNPDLSWSSNDWDSLAKSVKNCIAFAETTPEQELGEIILNGLVDINSNSKLIAEIKTALIALGDLLEGSTSGEIQSCLISAISFGINDQLKESLYTHLEVGILQKMVLNNWIGSGTLRRVSLLRASVSPIRWIFIPSPEDL